MTIKDLKRELENLPDDAEAFFTLWTDSGPKNYWFNPVGGKRVYEGLDGKQFALIAYSDDCLAYSLFTTGEGIMLMNHERTKQSSK